MTHTHTQLRTEKQYLACSYVTHNQDYKLYRQATWTKAHKRVSWQKLRALVQQKNCEIVCMCQIACLHAVCNAIRWNTLHLKCRPRKSRADFILHIYGRRHKRKEAFTDPMSLWSDEHAQLHVPRHKNNVQCDIKWDYENLQHWSMEVPDQLIPNNCTIISTLTFHI